MFDRIKRFMGFNPEPKRVAERAPETIQVGDAIEIEGDNYTVQQRIEYRGDGGAVWWDYVVQTADGRRTLGVVDDDGLELTVWDEVRYFPTMPPAATLEVEGETYHRAEYGFANATTHRRSGIVPGRVEYWDYESTSGQKLNIERWGENDYRADQSQMTGTIQVSRGRSIKPYQLKIYPGSAPIE